MGRSDLAAFNARKFRAILEGKEVERYNWKMVYECVKGIGEMPRAEIIDRVSTGLNLDRDEVSQNIGGWLNTIAKHDLAKHVRHGVWFIK